MPHTGIATRNHDDYSVVTMTGEFDLGDSDDLRITLRDHLNNGFSSPLIIDLTAVTFMDSTVLGVLVGARKLATERKVPVVLVGASGAVRRLLQITQVDRAFTSFPSLDAALAELVLSGPSDGSTEGVNGSG